MAVLFREGQAADSLCVLIDGLIQLFTADASRETTILILRPSTWFATEAVLDSAPLLTSVRAIRASALGSEANASKHRTERSSGKP
jgi:CRP/FNR family transcriptional activator FtrB